MNEDPWQQGNEMFPEVITTETLLHPHMRRRIAAKPRPYKKRYWPKLYYHNHYVHVGYDAQTRMLIDSGRVRHYFGLKLHDLFNEVLQYYVSRNLEPTKDLVKRSLLGHYGEFSSGRDRCHGVTELCQEGILVVATPKEAYDWCKKNGVCIHTGDKEPPP